MDKRDLGMIFGNALTNTANLYSKGVLEFVSDAWQDELVSEVAVLTRAALQAQVDLGNELNLPEPASRGRSQTSPKQASNGPTSTGGTKKGKDPDEWPYVPSDDPPSAGQVNFIKSLLDERNLTFDQFQPLLNKENTKRAIYRMVNKGAQTEEDIFNGIL